VRGAFCGTQIGIVYPDGVNILVEVDTTIVLDQVGEYQILCNTPGGALQRTFEIATCLRVSDAVVPTMGEWTLTCLAFLLAIFGVIALKGDKVQSSVTS